MTDNREFSPSSSLTEEIADVVRERILRGEYEIGEKIKENQIATELRVSRTPIREAFKLLENEGLIDYVPNRGCFAKGFTKQDVEDIYAVRESLEELAVVWAVERISPEEISALEEQCEMMEFYTKNGPKKGFGAQRRFSRCHLCLGKKQISCTGFEILQSIHRQDQKINFLRAVVFGINLKGA